MNFSSDADGRHSRRTAQLLGSQSAHARAGASQRAPTQHLRTVHTTHCVAIAVPCACDSGSLSSTCRRLRHRLPKLCSAAAIARTASIRHQRHLTRIRSLSRRTRRAVAARVFAHLLGAERASAASRVLFPATSTPRGRGYRCCAGPLGRSLTTRCAEQQRRGAASHRRWPTALPTESFVPPPPSISPPPSSPRPPPASRAGSPRTSLSSASSERPPGIVRVSQGCVCG